MRIGPKYKIARRLGTPVFEKTQTEKFVTREARRAKNSRGKRPRPKTGFGAQLLEKQKARYTYNIAEKQFAKYVKESLEKKGNPSDMLYAALESRLDNVVYRAGFAGTRQMARQLVSHGHILVNGKKTNIPSHATKEGDIVSVREGSKNKKPFEVFASKENDSSPKWISVDTKKGTAKVGKVDPYDSTVNNFNLTTVIEYYSR
ncbi:30S ribosomal protein S4 [Candidatus Campbellbacteria bacterium CG22_combo_CG10-13_8_21_14_all_36_13]|uniref:Small ribosomal subunit protein uS4 n=1 Tax=Candidatus Campbellbacteria bacterium CG22_combo_CG10-13_8_21_14_all_36_13 TaxID=1974529 RepID=A0A2H0DYL0_9BACT|nr:MAG: 30S ribosomal protein S4 [Candidatus Campbellbacteria bacterium CG22_combo_CG10-13_8_21_14_all_36_13]